jgi:alkylation response protein AidB-like acyl-CoA dehydrogenase
MPNPRCQQLGETGDGFHQALGVLDGGRISIAALSLGIAKGALEAAIQYSKERHQFDQPIANFQGISFKLADMATEIAAAELLTFQAADLKNRHLPMTKQAAMAKYYASEVAVRTATEAVQIFGGYGYTKDFRWKNSIGTANCVRSAREPVKSKRSSSPGKY